MLLHKYCRPYDVVRARWSFIRKLVYSRSGLVCAWGKTLHISSWFECCGGSTHSLPKSRQEVPDFLWGWEPMYILTCRLLSNLCQMVPFCDRKIIMPRKLKIFEQVFVLGSVSTCSSEKHSSDDVYMGIPLKQGSVVDCENILLLPKAL